jgi:outer membrane protein OmpA-like peptidoglycan-associated protein
LTPNFTITSGLVSAGASCAGAVVIPAGVTGINGGAFAHSPMTSISIPSSVTSIGASSFRYAALTTITVNINNQNYTSTSDVLFNKASTALIAYPAAKNITSYSIPETVTSIGDHAFEDANLTSITIPSSVTSIGEGAFKYSSLASATIPSSVTSIGAQAFAESLLLTSAYFLGNAPATVGTAAFLNTASGAKAYIKSGATGFTTSGTPALWNGLAVEVETTTPVSAPAPVVANSYRADKLGTVYFTPLSSKLSKAAKKQIKASVISNPSAIYKLTGYVQKSGSSKNDASLSLARARAVEDYLVSLGAGVNFTVVVDAGLVPAKNGTSDKARRATLYAMTPVVQ